MSWEKVTTKGAPEWLFERVGAKSRTYYIRYRKEGINLEEAIPGDHRTWKDAASAGWKILETARGTAGRGGEVADDKVRSEDIFLEILGTKGRFRDPTIRHAKTFFDKHMIPYFNEFCPFAVDFDATHWIRYKTLKRLQRPGIALANHAKYFKMFAKYTHEKGLVPTRIKIEFKEAAEDDRAEGQVIPDGEFNMILKHASQDWRDRMILQRFTGMRPGEVSRLKKVRFDRERLIISLLRADTKTKKARSFVVASKECLEILRRRLIGSESDYFFPGRLTPGQPVDKSLRGWHSAIRRANVELAKENKRLIPDSYTPHDLRHTFLTLEFKRPGAIPALICYMAGLSLEEAQKTYLHFKPEDTAVMAQLLAEESARLLKADA